MRRGMRAMFKVTNNIALDNNQNGGGDTDLDRDSGATGTFSKNVFGTCNTACPAF